jgi:hypothetical protein
MVEQGQPAQYETAINTSTTRPEHQFVGRYKQQQRNTMMMISMMHDQQVLQHSSPSQHSSIVRANNRKGLH